MTAAGAETVEFEAVSLNCKAVPSGDFLLQLFDLTILKFDDFSATRADEVIVMSLVSHVIVLCLRTEMPRLCDAGVAKQVQGPIDRGQTQMGVRLGELMVHGLRGDVFLPKKSGEDQFPLAGEFQLMFSEVFLQNVHFFRESPGCHVGVSPTGGH